MISVGIMAIATIPESTAHLYQISLYVDHLAEEQGREKLGLSKFIGLNLMLDGLNDLVNGLFGSTAGTNYGENNSLMVISRNYSGVVLITAGAIAMLLGFIGPLKDFVNTVPTAVWGGLAVYLYGVIGMQGIALMIAEKVDLYDPGKLAIGATHSGHRYRRHHRLPEWSAHPAADRYLPLRLAAHRDRCSLWHPDESYLPHCQTTEDAR